MLNTTLRIFLLTLSVSLSLSAISCGSSTPELCDRACTAWNNCQQVDGNYVNYPYDTCYDECIEEGDWDEFYVQCAEDAYTCPEIGNTCG